MKFQLEFGLKPHNKHCRVNQVENQILHPDNPSIHIYALSIVLLVIAADHTAGVWLEGGWGYYYCELKTKEVLS